MLHLCLCSRHWIHKGDLQIDLHGPCDQQIQEWVEVEVEVEEKCG